MCLERRDGGKSWHERGNLIVSIFGNDFEGGGEIAGHNPRYEIIKR